ncbi:ABC transporter permease subunit [Clostridium sp. BL-8]|uniref:PhnE/PtxC family ABC transporter permease n=1 Tax=Clostridium sp. BL-8 TaxID=349938 RepID=UPI00098C348F|nr:ABC transporter permease subunit [Clostridium sp. BL-8]OOM78625.1 phosphate-import permease protein PhnE [Clostridium sp. BL-8]
MEVDVFVKRRNNGLIFFTLIIILTVGSIIITQYDVSKGFTSFIKAFEWGASNFYPDVKSLAKLPDIFVKLKDTVLMSIASTTVAAIFSLSLALIGSRATRINNVFTIISRGIASLFRNIPLVAWAMVLMLAFSQSALTGFLALFLGSIGFLTRAFMEAIDEVSDDTIEALKATGASNIHIIFQAILPSSMPQIVSWLLFMIETNIRDATLVGLLTGTGIGFLFDIYYKAFNYHTASLIVVVTVIIVIITEKISNIIRRMIL